MECVYKDVVPISTREPMSANDKALNFFFFAAEVNDAKVAELKAAYILAEARLKRGSRIDVWVDDRFWAARIMTVGKTGFKFRYCCKSGAEYGFVNRADFQTQWRFPVDNARQVVFAEALKKVMDPAA
jgi:hypothetical protein